MLYPQINIRLQNIIELPTDITENEFIPTNLSVSATGIYLLDGDNRQIAFMPNVGDVIFSGGYGTEIDAFIDPIDIHSSKLSAWIVDNSENKLIEFDRKLNYLNTVVFNAIYPEFSGIDDWGNIALYSSQEQMVYKAIPPTEELLEFIDLSVWSELASCVDNFHVAQDGSLGILAGCSDYIYIFNRLGKLTLKYPFKSDDIKHLIKVADDWLVIGHAGQMISVKYNEIIDLKIDSPIIDVVSKDGLLYILFSKKIWVIDVSVE